MTQRPGRRDPGAVADFSRWFGPVGGGELTKTLRRLKEAFAGMPAPHAITHLLFKGQGDPLEADGIIGTSLPTPIVRGGAAATGDPRAGGAAVGHSHPFDEPYPTPATIPSGGRDPFRTLAEELDFQLATTSALRDQTAQGLACTHGAL